MNDNMPATHPLGFSAETRALIFGCTCFIGGMLAGLSLGIPDIWQYGVTIEGRDHVIDSFFSLEDCQRVISPETWCRKR
ncbi:MAG: hypothetical protein V6Z86_05655 [Hyphomicrobiales bacterium]